MQGNFEPFKSSLSFVPVEIKERILIKSQELYFTRGIRSVTMDEIAAALGISKKTIYLHFSDKRSLVEASTKHFLAQEKCAEKKIYEASTNPVEEIILSTQLMREMLTNINPAIFHDLQKYYPKTWKHYLAHKEDFRDVVLRNLNEGIKQGLYRPDIHPAILANLRIESVDMAFNPVAFPPIEFNILDVQLAFIDHFLRGIVTEKGLKVYEEIK
ncbi:MAG: AcrR family transcriptional regulator [Arcticibacterium sp.]|jgi:AcrR family transcriptional regulator